MCSLRLRVVVIDPAVCIASFTPKSRRCSYTIDAVHRGHNSILVEGGGATLRVPLNATCVWKFAGLSSGQAISLWREALRDR